MTLSLTIDVARSENGYKVTGKTAGENGGPGAWAAVRKKYRSMIVGPLHPLCPFSAPEADWNGKAEATIEVPEGGRGYTRLATIQRDAAQALRALQDRLSLLSPFSVTFTFQR